MLDQKNINDVRAFQKKFGIPMAAEPTNLTVDEQKFRADFLQEELDEYRHAVAGGDLTAALDSLIDLVYVAYGTALMHGFGPLWQACWNAVHEANMNKVRVDRAENGRHRFDVVKPAGWESPNTKIMRMLLAAIMGQWEPSQQSYGEAAVAQLLKARETFGTETVDAELLPSDEPGVIEAELAATEGDAFTDRLLSLRVDENNGAIKRVIPR